MTRPDLYDDSDACTCCQEPWPHRSCAKCHETFVTLKERVITKNMHDTMSVAIWLAGPAVSALLPVASRGPQKDPAAAQPAAGWSAKPGAVIDTRAILDLSLIHI